MEPILREITDEEVRRYQEDGVVLLKQLFNKEWVARLRNLAEEDMQSPGRLHQELSKDGGRFFFDTFLWTFNPGFKEFVFNSAAAEIAGRVMGADKVNIFFDQLLIKEPGTSERTPWHHDVPYWPVRGDQVCTLWLALDEVDKDNGAVEYIKGSHRWGNWFKPPAFAGDDRYKIDLEPVPDIEAEKDKHEIIQFELEPGDCTVHHGLLVHGAPGNSEEGKRRRAYVTRWAGDDAVYTPMPNIQEMMWDPGIPAGSALDCDLWPVVWTR